MSSLLVALIVVLLHSLRKDEGRNAKPYQDAFCSLRSFCQKTLIKCVQQGQLETTDDTD